MSQLSVTAGTGITVTETDAVELSNLRSGNGSIQVTADGAIVAKSVVSATDSDSNDITLTGRSIEVDTINAGTLGDVTLTATGGWIDDRDNNSRLTADDLSFSATEGVGSTHSINTTIAEIIMGTSTGAGSIAINESDALVVTSLTNFAGSISLQSGGGLTIANVSATDGTDSADVTLISGSSVVITGAVNAGQQGDITINSNGVVSGNVTGDHLALSTRGDLNLTMNLSSLTLVLSDRSADPYEIVFETPTITSNIRLIRSGGTTTLTTGAEANTIALGRTGVENLVLNTGAGNDVLYLKSNFGTVTANTGAGTDRIYVGSAAPSGSSNLTTFDAGVTVNGGADADTLYILNGADTTANSGQLTATQFTGFGLAAAGITYAELETLDINLGSGADRLHIADTHNAYTGIETNAGADTVTVNAISGQTDIYGGAGSDRFLTSVNASEQRTFANAIHAVLNLHGGSDNDQTIVNFAGIGTAVINVYDQGSGTDGLTINSSNNADTILIRDTFVASLNGSVVERVNMDSQLESPVIINTIDGEDAVLFDDTDHQYTVDTGSGNDTVQIGQLFATAPAGLGTASTTYGTVSNGISDNSTINTGVGDDTIHVYQTRAPINLNGGSGADRFEVQPFVLNAGGYLLNETISIQGDADADYLTFKGTALADAVMIEATQLKGMGQTINYQTVETISVDTGNNVDSVFAVSTAAGIQTNVVTGSGNDVITVAGNVSEPIVTLTSTQQYSTTHNLYNIAGALSISAGDSGTYTLKAVTVLPTESNTAGAYTITANSQGNTVDELYFFNDENALDQRGTLSSGALTGFGMAGGITYASAEIVELLLGTGNETLTVTDNASNAITLIHGGGGADTITVQSGGGTSAPLVIYGDTSQDRSRYAGVDGHTQALGTAFVNDGGDTINASVSVSGLSIFGGAGDDHITGSQAPDQLFGGSGNDTIYGEGSVDHMYGDSEFSVNRHSYAMTITTDAVPGMDTLYGGDASDILLGDHGLISLQTGQNQLTNNGVAVLKVETPVNTTGANDIIYGDNGNDVILGGEGADTTNGNAGNDIIVGDHGIVDYSLDANVSTLDQVTSTVHDRGGNDTLHGDVGNDLLIGGYGSDKLYGNTGMDSILGDSGMLETLAITDSAILIGTISTLDTVAIGSANDTIEGNEDDDVIIGGVGADTLNGNAGNDVIFGDNGEVNTLSNNGSMATYVSLVSTSLGLGGVDTINGDAGQDIVVGGAAGDTVYGNTGNDVLVGDNATLNTVAINATISIATINTTDTEASSGGADTIEGNEDEDLILGGMAGDVISGNTADDVLIGDNGRITQFSNDGTTRVIGKVETLLPDQGGDDTISGNENDDIILGGAAGDTINAGEGHNVVLGDNGFIDYVIADGDASDIDRIESTDPAVGGADTITTGTGDDIVIGGTADDSVTASSGSNLVIGDSGRITAGASDVSRFGAHALTLGRIETIAYGIGGVDTITTLEGRDIILGGHFGDSITGSNLTNLLTSDHNIVLGDDGYIDFDTDAAANPVDVDAIVSTSTTSAGGVDTINAGNGHDIILGGRFGDTLNVGEGDNIVFGDSAQLIARAAANPHAAADYTFGLGVLSSLEFGDGGTDTITSGSGKDTIVAGIGLDSVTIEGGDNSVVGDNGELVYTVITSNLETISSTATNIGDKDTITTGAGDDVIIGGLGDDVLSVNEGDNVVIGDNGFVQYNGADANPLTLDVAKTTAPEFGGGDDSITGGSGNDVLIGGDDDSAVGDKGDSINAGDGVNVVQGDNGQIDWYSGQLDKIASTEPEQGGSDEITTGTGNDTIVAGQAGDNVVAGEGDNRVIGDNGELDYTQGTGALKRMTTMAPSIGGADDITTGSGTDVVLGGAVGDTIHAGEGHNIVLGDNGFIDYVMADSDVSDIDRIESTDYSVGGIDEITTGAGDDIVIAGADGDIINLGDGDNIAMGDSGRISAAVADAPRWGSQPLTIGRIESIAFAIGGNDIINTGTERDIIIGGDDDDTIVASDLTALNNTTDHNIVLGDSGYIDYDDDLLLSETNLTNVADIDVIVSLSTRIGGGDDTIDTGDGDDIVIGGRFGDTIRSRNGDNLVFGDSGQITAATVDSATQAHFEGQPITLGRVATIEDTDGGADTIQALTGYDIILGGHEGDTIHASLIDNVTSTAIEILGVVDANIILGDTGYIDYDDDVVLDKSVAANSDDIDLIWSTTTVPTEVVHADGTTSIVNVGGADRIESGDGDDIIIGGRYDDTINSRHGDNLVFGDLGQITAATLDSTTKAHFIHQPITLGLVETVESQIGGSDSITTGVGRDIILGGINADTIVANAGEYTQFLGADADNIIFGDSGYIDWTAADSSRTYSTVLSGDDQDASDIDRVFSTGSDHGGDDRITTGDGNDIILGGEDGENIIDVVVEGLTTTERTVEATTNTNEVEGDIIDAGQGNNIVFGDNGQIAGAAQNAANFEGLPITLGLVETIDSLIGGSDSITTGVGRDIILGGIDADVIVANFGEYGVNESGAALGSDSDNIIFGDSGYIDWAAADASRTYDLVRSGDDTSALDIDRIYSTDPDHGGNDTITTGDGHDIILGGEDGERVDDVEINGVVTTARNVIADVSDGDTIFAGDGDNVIFGDNGQITAATSDKNRFSGGIITLGLVETIESLIGGSDSITTGVGRDIVLGGIDADVIEANNDEYLTDALGNSHGADADNIVIGDSGYIDWTADDAGRFYADATTALSGALSGDDSNALDIDRVFSTDPDHGGNDTITVGDGNDILLGGEDGEIVTDAIIGVASDLVRTVAADANGDGDSIDAGQGNNIVFGDNGQITAAAQNSVNFVGLPMTLGLVETFESLIGGSDSITTGVGRDIILGGIDADVIVANFGEYLTDENSQPLGSDGDNIVMGDSGYIDWTANDSGRFYADTTTALSGMLSGDDSNALDIDRVFSTDPDHGGNDTITVGDGNDIILGGEDGEIVTDAIIGVASDIARTVAADVDGDSIDAGQGNNIVFGDNGQITAATDVGVLGNELNTINFAGLPITLGLVETIESLIGGSDTITTGIGRDIVLGGIDADTIVANFGEYSTDENGHPLGSDSDNIVMGDSGYIDWTANDAGRFYADTTTALSGTLSGDDITANDIDRVFSTDPDHGGNDTITVGDGNDIIIGGEDGEIVTDAIIGVASDIARTVAADANRDGDSIDAGQGNNIVFGDNGQITAAAQDAENFVGLPITLGLVETIESLIGGSDNITTGVGYDIVLGGIDADTIVANVGEYGADQNSQSLGADSDNIIFGDSGYIDWTAADASRTYDPVSPGDDTNALDIDRVYSTDPLNGGNDTITTGVNDDIIIGGTGSDVVNADSGTNLILGDSGQITADEYDLPRFGNYELTIRRVETIADDVGDADTITTTDGRSIIIGGHAFDTIITKPFASLSAEEYNIVLEDIGYIEFYTGTAGIPNDDEFVEFYEDVTGILDAVNYGIETLYSVGSVRIDTYNDLNLTKSTVTVLNGNLTVNIHKDLKVRHHSDILVTAGSAFITVIGAIWLDDGSSLTVDNATAAFGNMQLNSGKTITVSDNSSINTINNYMVLIAQDHISLVDNSEITATIGYVIIQTRRDLTLVDSAMSLNNVTLFLQVERSLRVIRSTIHLNTGIAQLSVFVDATIEESSSLTVTNGDLYGQVNGNLAISDNSNVLVTEGNVGLNVIGNALVELNSLLEVDNSAGSGKSLQLIVSGTTTFDSNSALVVENAELNIFSFGDINLSSSTLTVLTGNVFIRTNANLTFTDSTLSMESGNLSVNVALSMYINGINGSHITVTNGSFYLNAGVDTIMDADSTLSVTGGDLYANIFGEAILGGATSLENLFAVYVQGNFTLTETGTLDAFIIYLSSGRNIAIDGRMDTNGGIGQVYLNAQGYIYMKSMNPIAAQQLSAASVTGVFLRTEVEQLTAQATGMGLDNDLNLGNYTGSAEIEIHEVDDVLVNTAYNANGPIRIMAGGTIQAVQVLSATDAPGHNIGLMSTGGDLELGFVSTGTTNGQISLSASGTIGELAGFDTAADVIGKMALIYADTSIATGDAGLELNVNEVHSFAVTDVIFETDNDVELFLLTGDSRVQIKTWLGDIIISRLLSNSDDIKLEAPNGIMDIGYLDAGEIEGFVDLDAGDDMTLIETTYDGQVAWIRSYEDVQLDTDSSMVLAGDIVSLTRQIDADAKGTIDVSGVQTGDEIFINADLTVVIESSVLLDAVRNIQVYSQNDGGNTIVRGILTAGENLDLKARENLFVETSSELSAGLTGRLDAERGTMTIDGNLEAGGIVVLLSEQEMQINGNIHGGGIVDVDTDNGNLILSGTLSSDRFIDMRIQGDRLEVIGTIAATEGVYIDSRLNNYTEISGEIVVSGLAGEAEVIMGAIYFNGITTDRKLVVGGRIVAAGRITLETYGELELLTGSYLTGTGNDATALVELSGATGVTITGRINTTSFIVSDSNMIITQDYSDRILDYTDDALTLGSEGLILDDNLVIKVDGDIDLSDVTVSGRIEIQASGTITVTSLNAGSGIVNLESIGGDVIIHSLDASTSSGVSLKAAGAIQVKSSVTEPGLTELDASVTNLNLEAQSILVEGDVLAGSDIDLTAEVNLTVNGTLDAGGNILLNGYSPATTPVSESLQINGTVTAGGTVTIDANSESILISGTVTADSDVTITAGDGIELSNTGVIQSIASVVNLTATNGDLSIAGSISAKQNVNLKTGAALEINGTVTSGTEVLMDVATTLLVDFDGQISSENQIVADVVGAITIEGALQAHALIDLYTEAKLTLGTAAALSTSDSVAGFIRLDAYKVLDEAASSQVNGNTELRITESIANLEWDVHGSTTWLHVEDNPDLLNLDLLQNGESVLLVSDTALLGEPAGAAYSLTDPSETGEATGVFLYALTVEVVTDLGPVGEQTIHYTAELLTNNALTTVEPLSDFDNIVSVSSEPLGHVDGLLGLEMTWVEIDATKNVDYQQALYSLLTRNS